MNLPTIIISVILVIIICIGNRSTKKRAASGCCGSSEAIKKVRVKDKNKDHYPYKAVLKVYDIHCQNCVHTIENAFNSQDGFYAKVNTEDNTVTILSKQQHPPDELINTFRNSYKEKLISKNQFFSTNNYVYSMQQSQTYFHYVISW